MLADAAYQRYSWGMHRVWVGILGSILWVQGAGAHTAVHLANVERAKAAQAEWQAVLSKLCDAYDKTTKKLEAAQVQYVASDFEHIKKKICDQAKLKNRPMVVMTLATHNTGKSTLTNNLLGVTGDNRVVKTSAVGGSTKIPTVLLPESFADADRSTLFPGFDLRDFRKAREATLFAESGKPTLLVRKHGAVPANLAIVDNPDVDSYHLENGFQARSVIDVADVVVAMVTTSGYANRDFVSALMEVGKSGKPVMLVHSRTDFLKHRKIWAHNTEELRRVAGINLIGTYVFADEPDLAERGEMIPFASIGLDGTQPPKEITPIEALYELDVPHIRIQSEWGALKNALGAEHGLEALVGSLEAMNVSLTKMRTLIDDPKSTHEAKWPDMPSGVIGRALVEEWAKKYRGWVSTSFRYLPKMMKSWGGRWFTSASKLKQDEREKEYRNAEFTFLHDHILLTVLRALEKLSKSGKVSGPLSERLAEITSGVSVSEMELKLKAAHDSLNLVDKEMKGAIISEMEHFAAEHPWIQEFIKNMDSTLSVMEFVAGPMIGLVPSYFLAGPMASTTLTAILSGPIQGTAWTATTVAAAPFMPVVGDEARLHLLSGAFQRILKRYAKTRELWLMDWLKKNYLAEFYEELEATADATSDESIAVLKESISCAKELVQRLGK